MARWTSYDIPDSPYWLFDLTSTQQAISHPFEILPYRYGGMAYRGPEPFVKGKLDVLTSPKVSIARTATRSPPGGSI